MLSRFFIERPIFASVLSIVIVLIGFVALTGLPIAQYPEISPPMIQVTAVYPGADPEVIADTVAAPIEQEVNGVERMLYMSSTSAADGSYTLKISFELGTDVDMANVLVQNRVARATARLPQEVQRQGITVKKASTTMVNVLSVFSPDDSRDDLFIANFVTLALRDRLARVPGVGDLNIIPQKDYGMRIWLDPQRLEGFGLTTLDVVDALRKQNVQIAAGQIGQQPAPDTQQLQLTVRTQGRLTEVAEFEDIILRAGDGTRILRVKDVARVELGGKSYDTFSTSNGKPAATIVVYQSPGSNALAVADAIQSTLAELRAEFPTGVDYSIVYDVSLFVRASIESVVHTLIEAFILVFIVVFVFLQDWRATLIPTITIPVSLIGTFAVMAAFGFSLNTITLLGLVLAIGIVVDDAIVVVENVERNMAASGLSPKDAAIKAMEQVTGPVIGITLVLMAVFLPASFLPGISGELFRQFSLTIAVTTFFSAVNALTLSPALCALLLRPHHGPKFILARWFNAAFDRFTAGYAFGVKACVKGAFAALIVFGGLLWLTGDRLGKLPTGFVPAEDDGLVLVGMMLPPSASLNRTREMCEKVGAIVAGTDGVQSYTVLGGTSIIDGAGSNVATIFAPLTPWDERIPRGRSQPAIVAELRQKLAAIQEGIAFVFTMPPIPGVGTGSGFEMMVQDRVNRGPAALAQGTQTMMANGNAQADLRNVLSTYIAAAPGLFADIDREKAFALKVPLSALFDTLQSYLGSAYVNDFNLFGRTWQVKAQADSAFRARADDITRLTVRNELGQMVPLGAILSVRDDLGPPRVERYNLYPSARVTGVPAPGISTGTAIATMEELANRELGAGMGFEWTGMAFEEKKASGSTTAIVFGLACILVLLILAAQYESWIDPIVVVVSVPLAILGAAIGLAHTLIPLDVFAQIGLVLLVGLAAKNAILIVEFARELRHEGKSLYDATIEAARLRFRPILMTSLAFILGVVPLVIASGAGANSQRAIGTTVFGGMIGSTVLGLFLIPMLYYSFQWVRGKFVRDPAKQATPAEPPTEPTPSSHG
jgi:hydrophobic/amphiphilic exporter-1 (mainly G- bacteria), HAE1 family